LLNLKRRRMEGGGGGLLNRVYKYKTTHREEKRGE